MASEEDDISALFEDPEGFYEPSKPYTFKEYQMLCGRHLTVRLVGHNPLWGHHLWQAGIVISRYLELRRHDLVEGQTILELGAGAGLPSLVAAYCGAKKVVITDYPDLELIENIQHNINNCELIESPFNGAGTTSPTTPAVAQGYLWGSDEKMLFQHVSTDIHQLRPRDRFNTLILADLLFNHSCHESLFRTIEGTLAQPPTAARALVFFTPYRPWLLDKDLAFFDLLKKDGRFEVRRIDTEHSAQTQHPLGDNGEQDGSQSAWADLGVEYVGGGEWHMNKVMFEDDRGDERLRRTVFGYEIKRKR
ncbi:MAG: nicotinamide n-methyltransferase [Alyxoria varia]|nr:MAG: nicotinamide n-methyltransferase [Alyxoria varia]